MDNNQPKPDQSSEKKQDIPKPGGTSIEGTKPHGNEEEVALTKEKTPSKEQKGNEECIPYFPEYKAHLKAFNFLKKTTVRLIVQCALYVDHSFTFPLAQLHLRLLCAPYSPVRLIVRCALYMKTVLK